MKITALFIATALTAASALAGGGLGIFGTYWDADDTDDPAIGGGIKLKAPLMPNLCMELRGSYLVEFADGTDEESLIPLEAGLVIEFPIAEQLTLYAGGGAGYFISPEYEVDDGMGGEVDVDLDDEVGYYAVAGAELKLNESVAIFAEAKYTAVEFDGAEVEGIDVDFEDSEMKGLGVNAGLMLLW